MAIKNYSFEPGGPSRVTISLRGKDEKAAILLDGEQVAAVGKQELKEGYTILPPDGSTLYVQQLQTFWTGERLTVLRDGQPLARSASDFIPKWREASGVVFFVAAASIGLGLVVELANISFLRRLGLGWGSVVMGCIFLVLAFLIELRMSAAAMATAMALFALDAVSLLVLQLLRTGQRESEPAAWLGGALFVRLIFLRIMLDGFLGMRMLKKLKCSPKKVREA